MTTAKDRKIAKLTTAHADLIVVLTRLAAIPGSSCLGCGRTDSHSRCSKCSECCPIATNGAECACGAKSSYYRSAVYLWEPKRSFASTFGAELLEKITIRGWAPSEKQIALAMKLDGESKIVKAIPTTNERPAMSWCSVRSRAFKALVQLAAREVVLTPATVSTCKAVRELGKDAGPEALAIAAEVSALIQGIAARLISDATGYDVLATTVEFSDAMSITAWNGKSGKTTSRGDRYMHAALEALLSTHSWILSAKMAVEPTVSIAA